jgi:hypothetical protein
MASLKSHPRAHVSDDIVDEPRQAPPPPSTETAPPSDDVPEGDGDELLLIRQLLEPPPLVGVENWGIPPESTEPCDAATQARSIFFACQSLSNVSRFRQKWPNF